MSLLLLLLTAALFAAAHSQTDTYANCERTFSCGHITNVSFPFTGGDRPSYCGLPDFALTCRDGTTTELAHDSLSYRILQLDQTQKLLVLARVDLYNNTCPSGFRNITLNRTYFSYDSLQNEDLTMFYGCNTSRFASAGNNSADFNSQRNNRFNCSSSRLNFTDAFYWIGPVPSDPILRIISCNVSVGVPMLKAAGDRLSNSSLSLGEALMQGFDVSYSVQHERLCSECNRLTGQCGFNAAMDQLICICGDKPCPFNLTIPPAASPDPTANGSNKNTERSIVIIAITICCFLRRRHFRNGPKRRSKQDVENLLLQHGSLAPKRYKYSEIKKMTKSLSDKLGQGGFGSVYKGMLPDGRLVAVKILSEIDSNGEEFINEVASISRTSHVNIVTLLGFCYEGNKSALVYEYMPNKSLDKFLSNNGEDSSVIDDKKLYEIAVGIAKGLEYLHIGCITRIVHFDIKPQNILLDDDLCPKISDFGLAKLCKKKQSALSVSGTRGTAGYIAPEVFSRNFGAISHKSDVYSYGMLLLEMFGTRKNVGIQQTQMQSSENYFPDKIYEQVMIDVGSNLDESRMNEDGNEEERMRKMKMMLIGFWCIQTNPSERPTMSKVLEMLEGSVESIQIPPKPFLISTVIPRQQTSSSISASRDTDNSTVD